MIYEICTYIDLGIKRRIRSSFRNFNQSGRVRVENSVFSTSLKLKQYNLNLQYIVSTHGKQKIVPRKLKETLIKYKDFEAITLLAGDYLEITNKSKKIYKYFAHQSSMVIAPIIHFCTPILGIIALIMHNRQIYFQFENFSLASLCSLNIYFPQQLNKIQFCH